MRLVNTFKKDWLILPKRRILTKKEKAQSHGPYSGSRVAVRRLGINNKEAGEMRDVLYKNMTSLDHHRRDVFLSEASVTSGVTTRTQKHFIYSIRDHELLDSPQKLEQWVKEHAQKGPRLKDLSVVKTYNSKVGEEKFEVKIVGNLYVLREQDIFNVDFTQIFKIDRQGISLKK